MLIKKSKALINNKIKIYDLQYSIKEGLIFSNNHLENNDKDNANKLQWMAEELQKSRENSFHQGFQQGEKIGHETALKSIQPHIECLTAMLISIKNQQDEVINQSETFVVNFVLKIVEKILGSEEILNVKIDKNKLYGLIKDALRNFSDSTKYNVRVHKDVAELYEFYKSQILESLPKHLQLSLIEDSSLNPGDCLIETDYGVLDARIATQLEEIKNIFKKEDANGNADTL